MKKKISFVLLLLIVFSQFSKAQESYWVFLRDKNLSHFSPVQYFNIKAIERRLNAGCSLTDSTDFPVSQTYIDSIKKHSDSLIYASRWLNAVAVKCNYKQLAELEKLPFVNSLQIIQSRFYTCSGIYDTILSFPMKKLLRRQTSHLQARYFSRNKINGKGIRIAVFDAGFPKLNKIIVFRHLFDNHKIILTYNFTKGSGNVYSGNPHGTEVLSCIAGKTKTRLMGLAPNAEFLLAHTELKREVKIEEVYWVQALEWADKNGAQIVNSSLGYTYHRYFPNDMNGKVSVVAKAATMAARKGMLIVNSMGNDGNNDWKVLSTPADADSILSVGAISPYTGYHSRFSSLGPTADFRLKPNVVAFGKAVVAGQKGLKQASGTSFSAPLVTGFAACVWQMHPDYTNMQVISEIEKSASLYPYFDYAQGYGVPQASYFFSSTQKSYQKSFSLKYVHKKIIIYFNPKFVVRDKTKDYLYYHIADANNHIIDYYVIDRDKADKFEISTEGLERDCTIRIFYKGTFKEFKISDL